MKKVLLSLVIITCALVSKAQSEEDYNVPKSMLIIFSTKNYKEAKTFAEKAAKKLMLELNFRGLRPAKNIGLSLSSTECDENEWGYPCYEQRGREGDKEYVSIEYSNEYPGLTKNLYIVVAALGDGKMIKTALTKTKKIYKNAYVKKPKIYMGCEH